MIPKLVEPLSTAVQRALALLFGLVIGLLLLVAVSANQRDQEVQKLASLEKSMSALHTYASTVAAYVRRVLIEDYPSETNDPDAVHHLLQDTFHARRLVNQIGDRIGDNRQISTEKRVAVNPLLNDLLVLFFFNQPDYVQIAKSEPALHLAETSIGTYRWGDSLEDRSIDELARLGYLASIRPALLMAGLSSIDVEAIAVTIRDSEIDDLLGRLSKLHLQTFSTEARQARKDASALWKNWLRFKTDDRIDEELVARASQQSLAEEYLRIVREIEQLKAVQEGRTDAELPGLPQPVELRLLLFFFPYVVGGIYLYIAWMLSRMKSCVGQAAKSQLQEWIATTTPLIAVHNENRASLIVGWICRAVVVSLPLVTVVVLSFNRSANDLGLGISDATVSVMGVVFSGVGFLCAVVSAIQTSRILAMQHSTSSEPAT